MNILTFDIEDWFHILDHRSTKTESDWLNYESRIEKSMETIFEFLNKRNLQATFFVVGWIAEKYPEIVKRIDYYGYDIGSHTHMHQLLFEQNQNEVFNDIQKSIYTIEDLISKKVRCFRAPGFSITERNKWVFDVLIKLGIEIDCSIFPANRAHGGLPSFTQSKPTKIMSNNLMIKEFPINTVNFFFKKLIFSGGGYFRLVPYNLIKRFTKNSDYVMSYFHPRDFDINQPVIKDLTLIRKFKSYYGIKDCLKKLEFWTKDFDFIDLKAADMKTNWDEVDTVII